MIHERIARRPNLPMAIAASFLMLTFVQLLCPLSSITLKRRPEAATSRARSYRHTVEEVDTAGNQGVVSNAPRFQRISFYSTPTMTAAAVNRSTSLRPAWRERSKLFYRKLPPAAADPGH